MKKAVLTLLLLLPIIASADNIPEQKARAVAESFFGLNPQTKASSHGVSLVWDGENTKTKASGTFEPAFYVYSYDKGGYVIVSADDIASPVIAYSFDSQFTLEGMPENVSSWFAALREAINEARANAYLPTDKTIAEWLQFENTGVITAGSPVTLLETALWDQNSPFNDLCPKDGSKASYTGCAATAQAIVLRYHKYPSHGTGCIPAYTTETKKIKVQENPVCEHYYIWDQMPLVYDKDWTPEQKNEVAQIMYDCGTSLNMDYTAKGSGALSSAYRPALVNYFGISSDSYTMSADAFTTEKWTEKLKEEIDNVGPIIYSGYDQINGGHAFVLDGYDSEDYFHINFGWSGVGNAFCLFPSFKSGAYNFNKSHTAVFNIVPSQAKDKGEDIVWIEKNGSEDLLESSTSTYERGSYFDIKVHNIFWSCVGEPKFDLALAHTDFYGKVKDIISAISPIREPGYGLSYITFSGCKINKDIEYLDNIILVYRYNNGDWQPAICPHDPKIVDEITLTNKGLDAMTSFEYDKQTLRITVNTVSGSSAYLKDAEGNSITKGVTKKMGEITIDTAVIPIGTYTLTISKGSDMKTITFTTGE